MYKIDQINNDIIELIKQNYSTNEILDVLNISREELYKRIMDIRNNGFGIYRNCSVNGDIIYGNVTTLSTSSRSKNNLKLEIPEETRSFKAILISDLHLGGKHERLDLLNSVYDYCTVNNINIIFNCGDLIDGLYHSCNPTPKDAEKLINKLITDYPFDKNILNLICLGNHDLYFLDKFGINLKNLLLNHRHDLVPIGFGNAKVIMKNDAIYMKHKLTNEYEERKISRANPIIFEGHKHFSDSKIYLVKDENRFCVPTLSNSLISTPGYPGFYEIEFKFNKNGSFKLLNIKLYCFKKNKMFLADETKLKLNDYEESNNKEKSNFNQLIKQFRKDSINQKKNKYE